MSKKDERTQKNFNLYLLIVFYCAYLYCTSPHMRVTQKN